MNKLRFLLLLGWCLIAQVAIAQVPTLDPAVAREELQKRGLNEDEVRAKLQQRGIDIDNITPEQLPTLERTLQEVVSEIEAEKLARSEQSDSTLATQNPLLPPTVRQTNSAEEVAADKQVDANRQGRDSSTVQIWGQQIFRNQSLEVFRAAKDAKPPDSYVLGAGDELTVTIFGASQADFKYTIGTEGFIAPTNLPKIFLSGVTYGKAKELVRARFSQFYIFRPEQFVMSLNTARTVNVNIFGEVMKPGSYTISALNTAFNALVAAGGPSDIGSVRRIELIRNGERRRLDVYEFMNNSAKQFDYYLQDNDIIYVPVADRTISINGAIRRTYVYELLPEENLSKLIEYAGGVMNEAYLPWAQALRYDGDRKIFLDITLEDVLSKKADFILKSGDAVSIKYINKPIENVVHIDGAVDMPGDFALETTPRVRDLIQKSMLNERSRRDLAFLLRTNLDLTVKVMRLDLNRIVANPADTMNYALQAQDRIIVYALERYTDKSSISIAGAVRQPGRFDYQQGLRVRELIELAGGLNPDATNFAYLVRVDTNNPNLRQYRRIDLQMIRNQADSPENLVLQPNDFVQVLALSSFAQSSTINIRGAIRTPGSYRYAPSLTLRDVVTLSGGFELSAATNRIDVYRVFMENNQPTRVLANVIEVDKNNYEVIGANFVLQPYDEIVVRSIARFKYQQFVTLDGEVLYPGPYALLSDDEQLSDLIKRAGGLTPEAFPEGATIFRNEDRLGAIVTRLDKALKRPNSNYNTILREGDVVTIPKTKDLVTVRVENTSAIEYYAARFAFNSNLSVAYNKGRDARWYIEEFAAGKTKRARWRYITVEQPNGRIQKTKSIGFVQIYPKPRPGAVIRIGAKPAKNQDVAGNKEKKSVDWDKRLTQILGVATTLTTTFLAISALR
jgi:protein involved in polysaccharide export with SLBB domain